MINHGYLVHHGILGMKWGVRRFQNNDGTLTDAGKKRYKAKLSYETAREQYKMAKKFKIGGNKDKRRIAAARANMTMKKADYLYSKAKTDKAGERARDNYLSTHSGNGGLLGDKVDWSINGGYVNEMKKSMTAKYGKEYAEKQIKKAKMYTIAMVASTAAARAGMEIVKMYLENKNVIKPRW